MPKTRIVRLLRNGQITIPKEMREELGLAEDGLLSASVSGNQLVLEQLTPASKGGSQWAKDLYDLYAPVRKSLEGYTEKEINDAIDEAVRAVRAEQR